MGGKTDPSPIQPTCKPAPTPSNPAPPGHRKHRKTLSPSAPIPSPRLRVALAPISLCPSERVPNRQYSVSGARAREVRKSVFVHSADSAEKGRGQAGKRAASCVRGEREGRFLPDAVQLQAEVQLTYRYMRKAR